jgi:sulfotransferase family protein
VKNIFIISQPRSGSTLLQSVISNNKHVSTTSEPWFLLPLLNMFDPERVSAYYNHKLAVRAINDFSSKIGGNEVLDNAVRSFADEIYNRFQSEDIKYFLDKTPRYYLVLELIKRIFPDAKIIILKRNPFAVINSIVGDALPTRKLRRLYMHGVDILQAPLLMQEFAEKYRNDSNVVDIRYEDIVRHPQKKFQWLYDWLELPYKNDILDYSANVKFQGKMGDHKGIRKFSTPSTDSINRWEKRLKKKFWLNFLKGYSAYLGADFLRRYGDYKSLSNIPTIEFQRFKFVAENNPFCERGISKNMFMKYLTCRAGGFSGEL